MTPNRLLVMCLSATMMSGCAMFSLSSNVMIANGKKTGSSCFSESVEEVAKKIEAYFNTCDAQPLQRNTPEIYYKDVTTGRMLPLELPLARPVYGYENYRHSDTFSEVKSHVEIYPYSKRVSLLNNNYFNMTAEITRNDGNSGCPTSVVFYSAFFNEGAQKFRKIEQYIKTGELDEICQKKHPAPSTVPPGETIVPFKAYEPKVN